MLSSTVTTSSSVSNTSILSDSSLRQDSQQELKKRRKKLSPKQFANGLKNPYEHQHQQHRHDTKFYAQQQKVFGNNKHMKKSDLHMNNTNNSSICGSKNMRHQEVPVSSFSMRRSSKSTESSEVSSNNLTCSELDVENGTNSSLKTEIRLQRRKYIKCVLREDVELLVNLR